MFSNILIKCSSVLIGGGMIPAGWYFFRESGSNLEVLLSDQVTVDLLTTDEYKDILGPILKEGTFKNMGDVTNWELENNCILKFVDSRERKTGGSVENKMFNYLLKKEILDSLNRYAKNQKTKDWCGEKYKSQRKVRFTRGSDGLWSAIIPT